MRVQIAIAGRPIRAPKMHINDFVILDFFSNRSLINPPISEDDNPHNAKIAEAYNPYSVLCIG